MRLGLRVAFLLSALAVIAAGPCRAETPKALRIAGILSNGIEAAWEKAFVDSIARVRATHPHGLDIGFAYTESVSPDEAEEVIRDYAETGRFQIIFTDSSYADAVERVYRDYPEILFVFSGAGNHGVGENAYWVTIHLHESGYLMGFLAGRMTKTGTVGIVGSYPGEDTNDEINGFLAGVHDANPSVKRRLTFIASWYDPQKSAAATRALAAAGADYVLELPPSFEACTALAIGCFGNYADQNALAPAAIVTSSLASWDPAIDYIVDRWWEHRTAGVPYAAPMDPVWFGIDKGGTDLTPYHAWDARIPDAIKAEIDAKRAALRSGAERVTLDLSMPAAD